MWSTKYKLFTKLFKKLKFFRHFMIIFSMKNSSDSFRNFFKIFQINIFVKCTNFEVYKMWIFLEIIQKNEIFWPFYENFFNQKFFRHFSNFFQNISNTHFCKMLKFCSLQNLNILRNYSKSWNFYDILGNVFNHIFFWHFSIVFKNISNKNFCKMLKFCGLPNMNFLRNYSKS